MVDYNSVKSKIKDFRKRILKDITIKRNELALNLYDTVRSTIAYINEQLSNSVSAKKQIDVDTYSVQLYYLSGANELGEKKISVNYIDNTTYIGGKEVIPFDTFEYDQDQYEDRAKEFGDMLSKYHVVFRMPQSFSPPSPDFEDVNYCYYLPDEFQSGIPLELEGYLGEIPYMAEFDLYLISGKKLDVVGIKGVFDYFKLDLWGGDIEATIGSGGVIKVKDKNENIKHISYKFIIMIYNYSCYPADVMLNNKPHRADNYTSVTYLYITDIHLKSTPLIIFTHPIGSEEEGI